MSNSTSQQLQQAILGCLLAFPEERAAVESLVADADFLGEKYRAAFRFMVDNPDADALLTAEGIDNAIPCHEMLAWMGEEFLVSALPGYCRRLKAVARKERLYQALTHLRNRAEDLDADQLYDLAEKTIVELSTDTTNNQRVKDMQSLASEALSRLEDRHRNRGKIQGLTWGYRSLDRMTGGAHKGDMIVIAGRPSMGKSAFAMNVVENMAAAGHKAMVFSLEMNTAQLVDRMIASQSRVDMRRIRNGEFADSDWGAMVNGLEKLNRYHVLIDDSPGLSLRELRSRARQKKMAQGLDVIMVDYMTLMQTDAKKSDSRAREVGELSRGLKQLARELDVAMIVLCQLNRAVTGRKDTRPVMSDLRDSGEIEQDADVILFPFREAAECPLCREGVENPEHSTKAHQMKAEIIIEKQRNGPRNVTLKFVWLGGYQRFEEMADD